MVTELTSLTTCLLWGPQWGQTPQAMWDEHGEGDSSSENLMSEEGLDLLGHSRR